MTQTHSTFISAVSQGAMYLSIISQTMTEYVGIPQEEPKQEKRLILIDTLSNSSSWAPPRSFLDASNPGFYSERAGWRRRVLSAGREGWRFRGRYYRPQNPRLRVGFGAAFLGWIRVFRAEHHVGAHEICTAKGDYDDLEIGTVRFGGNEQDVHEAPTLIPDGQ